MDFFLQLLVNGVCIGLLYGISAMGFVMIFKSSSVLNFAHGELLALGAFFFLALITWAKLPILIAFILTLVGCFLLGFLIERFFLRPLIGEKLILLLCLLWTCRHVQRIHFTYLGRQPANLSGISARSHGREMGLHLYRSRLYGNSDYQHTFSGSFWFIL